MKLLPGRYLVTLRVTAGTLVTDMLGARVNLELTIDASGAIAYTVRKLEPNPRNLKLKSGNARATPEWETGRVEVERDILGVPGLITLRVNEAGTLVATAIAANGLIQLAAAEGSWRYKGQAAGQPPGTKPSTWAPHTGPILFLPANCGWFNGGEDLGEIIRWLAQHRGRVGLGLEATGSTGNQGMRTVDWRGAYQAHALKAVAVVGAAAAAGVPTKLDGINTNDFGKGWSAGWKDTPANRAAVLVITRQMAEGLLPFQAWCIVQPYSESKDWMPADFRRAVFDTWVKAGWSKARLCGGGIAETHTGELKPLKAPALAATDNGPAIEAHFGNGVWSAHTPNVARCTAYARHYLGRGVHASLYHRADRLHLLEHRAAYDAIITDAIGAEVPATTGDVVVKADSPASSKKPYIKWAPALPWKNKPGTDTCAWIKVNGVLVEQVHANHPGSRQHLGNIYGRDEHGVRGIKTGDVVTIEFQQIGGSGRLTVAPFVWPWPPT